MINRQNGIRYQRTIIHLGWGCFRIGKNLSKEIKHDRLGQEEGWTAAMLAIPVGFFNKV